MKSVFLSTQILRVCFCSSFKWQRRRSHSCCAHSLHGEYPSRDVVEHVRVRQAAASPPKSDVFPAFSGNAAVFSVFRPPFLPWKHTQVKLKLTLRLTSTPMSCWIWKKKKKQQKTRWESVSAPQGGRRMRPSRFLWLLWRFVLGIVCLFCDRTVPFPLPRPLPASSTCLHSAPIASPATFSSFLLNAVTDGPVLYLLSAMQLS